MWHIHNQVTHDKELIPSKGLRKEVSQIVNGTYIWNIELHVLNTLTHKEVTALDVFGAFVVLWIVSKINRGGIVYGE